MIARPVVVTRVGAAGCVRAAMIVPSALRKFPRTLACRLGGCGGDGLAEVQGAGSPCAACPG
jgi:hypothetical protein